MKKLILSFFIISSVNAMILIPKSSQFSKQSKMEDILTNVFYEELYKRTKDLKPEVEVKKAKISLNDGRRGKLLIERMKQKNREKLARMRGFDPD